MALAFGEPLDGPHKAVNLQLLYHLADHSRLALVLEEIAELRAVLLGGELLVETGGVGYGALDVLDPIDVPAEPLGNLFVGRLALKLGRKLVVDPSHLPYLLAHVTRDPNGAPLVGYSSLHRLPDPPCRVGGEAEA